MERKDSRVFAVLVALLLLCGCAPTKVKLYDSTRPATDTTDLRNGIVQTAVSLHGNPYRSGAKGADAFDCSGFIHYVYKRSGVTLPVTTEQLIKSGSEIPRDDVQPGDLVFFRIKKDLHVGIMLNRKEFIHASSSRGIVVDNVDAAYWKRTCLGYRTVLG